MPSRHSKNSVLRPHLSYHERKKADAGSVSQRLGSESHLPFGYCSLSSAPAEDPVVSPSGRIYSRECILEYLLTKSKDIKRQWKEFEEQEERRKAAQQRKVDDHQRAVVEDFKSHNDDASTLGKRSAVEAPSSSSSAVSSLTSSTEYQRKRQKLIDDTDRSTQLDQLKAVSPWVPQFTPQAEATAIAEPPKRPPSPFSGQPLRSKDLISITLKREEGESDSNSSTVRYVCPVSRKTITNQKVMLIKPTGAIMIEQAAKDLALPTMTCPLTGRSFTRSDLLELSSATSAFAATGKVEAKVYRPSMA